MKRTLATLTAAGFAGILMTGAAVAQATTATATTDLNIRSGPGPQFEPVGVIAGSDTATVEGCLQDSMWCQVSYEGTSGWAYSDYLVIETAETQVVLTERPPELVGVATYDDDVATVTGTGAGAIAGAIVGGPVGAAAGAAIGATASAVIPDAPAVTYVQENPLDPVYLEGEVVVGATLPETVTLTEIPSSDYRYIYVNGQPVLVEPQTREVIYIVR